MLTKTFALKYNCVHSSFPNNYNIQPQDDVHLNFCSFYQQMAFTINRWQLLSAPPVTITKAKPFLSTNPSVTINKPKLSSPISPRKQTLKTWRQYIRHTANYQMDADNLSKCTRMRETNTVNILVLNAFRHLLTHSVDSVCGCTLFLATS